MTGDRKPDSLPVLRPALAYALAAASMIVYGTPPVVTRAVSGGVPPLALSFSRWLIALVILLPLVWRKLPREWPELREHWPGLAGVALFMAAGSTLSVVAVYFTTATNAVIVNASQPAVTGFFAWVIAGASLTRSQRFGVACAFAGILFMISRGDVGTLLALDVNIGDPIMLLAVCGWSLYAVQLHRRPYVPSGELLMFIIALTGAITLAPAYAIEAAIAGRFAFRWDVVAAMLYLAVFPTLLATYSWNLAIRALGPNRSAIFVNLIPISGTALAMVFLGERLFVYHLIGAALVFAGIYLSVRRR